MKLLTLTIAAIIVATCGAPRKQGDSTVVAPIPTASIAPVAQETATKRDESFVPLGFKDTDFRNFSYPIRWRRQLVTLKDGRVEFFKDRIFHNAWFDLKGIDYADVNGDGKKEAIVQLVWVSCGASCDGGSWFFYFYESRSTTAKLLARIETGSFAYQECGLK